MKTLILAPHVDDELIGCYQVLEDYRHGPKENDLDVIWLYETTEERLTEGHRLAEYFGFTGAAVFSAQVPELIYRGKYDKIYVPARQDWHIDHKMTNQLFREFATHFYSVDMVMGIPLSEKASNDKRVLLDTFYPSQAKLWEYDAKYYLFTAVYETDIHSYVRRRYGFFSITAPANYVEEINSIVLQNMDDFNKCQVKAFNKLVSVCLSGELRFDHINGCIFKI
jgi:LmbE family N-acetylglucosaminyl deacetylase